MNENERKQWDKVRDADFEDMDKRPRLGLLVIIAVAITLDTLLAIAWVLLR